MTDNPESRAPADLQRFLGAQQSSYEGALAELRAGFKTSHWMWFIFPQVEGLGSSATSRHYAIRSLAEARAYLSHPVLGPRLVHCTEATLAHTGRSAREIFGPVDELKFRSCLTLFELAAGPDSVFSRALDRFFGGLRDEKTLELLERSSARDA